MSVPTKDEIGEILETIALLLELKDENPFKIRAYNNAARAVATFSGDLAQMAREERLEEIPGIGSHIAEKLTELINTGSLKYYDDLKSEFPASIFELFELQGLGAKKIKALYEKLEISKMRQLEKACRDGRVAALPGFGEKTAQNILKAIEQRHQHAGYFRLGDVSAEAEELLGDLRAHPDVIHVAVAGSYRRRKEIVHDLDFIISTKKPAKVTGFFATHPMVESVQARGETKSSVRLRSGVQADLRVVRDEEYPFALMYFTGSKEHNIVLRSRALDKGWTLNEYRLAPADGKTSKKAGRIPAVHSESDLYRALGLDFIPPELREDRGEFAAAEHGTIPELVELQNLRGTFHNHTTESDGRSSLEEMAAAAQELGLQYLGIADHSKSSFQAHGLSARQLKAQIKRIAELNKGYDGFRLFAGVECDILKNGDLDFSDDVLAQLDYVVASVHASFTLSEAEMTTRIIRAISNPHVTFLGHLTGRLLLSREPYKVNIPAVIEAAAETKTSIELNAHPMRLDMDWRWWPLAKEKGVKCIINPDAHHTTGLQHLWFGVAIARKGWLTRADVINCLPLGKIEGALAAKLGAKK
jgi:DNA polymerase (family 10)